MTQTRAWPVLVAGILALARPPLVLHDNGDPSQGFGTAVLSELDTINQVGDDFALSRESVVQGLEWWGTGEGNDFAIRVFAFDGGTPASEPLFDVDAGVVDGVPEDFSGQVFLHYHAVLPDLALGPGQYLLSVVDRTPDAMWFWAASCEDGCENLSWRRPLDGDDWKVGNFEMAFRLIGFVASCPWDLDGDGAVGVTDLLGLLKAWRSDPGGPPDFDGDGNVGVTDLLALLSHWGPCP